MSRDLGKKVADRFKQDFEGTVEGPHQVGSYVMSRVWTKDRDEDEYHAHYVVEHEGKLSMFDNFSPFAVWLHKQLDLDASMSRSEREIRIGIGSLVVMVGLGLLVYLMVWRPGQTSEVKYLLAAIVGAASSYVFLKRAPPQSK